MPYSNKQMLRDANGDLIPQYWDVVEQDFKPLTGQGGANDVRLTGSNVVRVINRKILNDSQSILLGVPNEVKGVIIKFEVHGVTGTFGENEGFTLQVNDIGNVSRAPGLRLTTKRFNTTSGARGTLTFYPGLNANDGTVVSGYETKFASVPIFEELYVNFIVTGTFLSDEGFDISVSAKWLY